MQPSSRTFPVAIGIVTLLIGLLPCTLQSKIDHVSDLTFPRRAVVKGACLEFNKPPYIYKRLAQFDLLAGASLYPEYWIEDSERERNLKKNLQEMQVRNNQIVQLATLRFPSKIFGVDPAAPASIWLRDMSGEAIPESPGFYYLDYSRPETIKFIAEHQSNLVKRYSEFNGIYLDQFSIDCPVPQYVRLDLNNDGSADSREELDRIWRNASLELLKQLRKEWGSNHLIVANINETLPEEYARQLNGVAHEGNFPADIRADQVREFLTNFQKQSELFAEPQCSIIIQWPKTELSSQAPELPWQELTYGRIQQLLVRAMDDESRFLVGLAMALFCDSFYAYEFGEHWPGQIWWFTEYNAPLGRSVSVENWEEYRPGIFMREFQTGRVYHNARDERWETSFDIQYHDMTLHSESAFFNFKPGEVKLLVRKLGDAHDYQFLTIPRSDLSQYPTQGTFPRRPLPEGVADIEVSSSRDATRHGLQLLIDGTKENPSVWTSDIGMPQHVEIEFSSPRHLEQITVWQQSDSLQHLIYDYHVSVWRNGEWETIYEGQNDQETLSITVLINRSNVKNVLFKALKTGDNRLHLREIEWK